MDFIFFLISSMFLLLFSIGNQQHGNVNGLKCHRQPLIGGKSKVDVLNKMEQYNCTDSRGEVYCLEATNCNPTKVEMKQLNMTADMIKHDIRECLGPYIFPRESSSVQIAGKKIDQLLPIPVPKIQIQNKVSVNESCERFYKPVRGCETCRICNDRDFCNDLHVPKEEANHAFGKWMGMKTMMLLAVYFGIVMLTASKMMEN